MVQKLKKKKENKFTPILQYTISQKEKLIQSKLNKKLTQADLEIAIQLRKIKKGLERKGRQKIVFQGSLKDNMIYYQSRNKLVGYLTLGFILISVLFGIVIIAEMLFYPTTIESLKNLLIISFGISILFILIYRGYSKKGNIT